MFTILVLTILSVTAIAMLAGAWKIVADNGPRWAEEQTAKDATRSTK